MIKFILHSFTFKGIFSHRDDKKKIVIFYLLILIIVNSFPLNLQIIRNDGWQELNTVTLNWRELNPSWLPNELPNDISINKYGLSVQFEKSYYFESNYQDEKNVLIINPIDKDPVLNEPAYTQTNYKVIDETGKVITYSYINTIILCKDKVIYYNDQGQSINGDYSKVKDTLFFSSLKELNQAEASTIFLDLIDNSFSKYIIFSSIMINTLTQFALNIILVLSLSVIFMLVRIKYQKVTTFTENINIVVASMTIPTLISFIVSIIGVIELNSFTSVIFQLLTPLIAIGAIYKGSKIKDPVIKGVV